MDDLIFILALVFFYLLSLILIWLLRRVRLLPQPKAKPSFVTSTWFVSIVLAMCLLIVAYALIGKSLSVGLRPSLLLRLSGKYISMSKATKLFENCGVKEYGFPHSGGVILGLKNGRVLYTERKNAKLIQETEMKNRGKCGPVNSWLE